MIRPILVLVALLLVPAMRAEGETAETGPVVVELFTSQGCSACPMADKLLLELSDHDDVLALSLHVDYWDYIGWEDEFGDPAHTRRQKAYAARAGQRMIYTPQMIVQGEERVVGTQPGAILEAIRAHVDDPATVALRAVREGGALRIEAHSGTEFDPPLDVQVIRYTPRRSASITRGENAGHHLDYANVVSGWETVAEWDGTAPLSIAVDAPGEDHAAVLVQRPGPGHIVAATRAD